MRTAIALFFVFVSAAMGIALAMMPSAPTPAPFAYADASTTLVPGPTPHGLSASVPIPTPADAGTVLTSNGPGLTPSWVAPVIVDAGLTRGQINLFPYVDTLGTVFTPISDGPSFTLNVSGVAFTPWVVGSVITGMRFVWARPAGGALTVQCDLWVGSSSVAHADVVNPSTGIVSATFSSPYTVLTSDLGGMSMVLSVYCPSPSVSPTGGYYTEVDFSDIIVPAPPVMASPLWRYVANQSSGGPGNTQTYGAIFGLSGVGSGGLTPAAHRPTTAFGLSRYFAMEPVFQ